MDLSNLSILCVVGFAEDSPLETSTALMPKLVVAQSTTGIIGRAQALDHTPAT